MVVSESTGSTLEVAEMQEACTTTGSSSTNTILVTSVKVGMRYFHKLRNKFHCPIVNIDKLWSMVPQDVKDKATKDTVPMIDVTQFGYFKVLGKGVLPEKQPIVVKAKLVSKIAEKKIKEAGGAVVLTA
ncbi:60S ribosomal protein L27a-3 [Populus alba x Populus x berolinensis]|nr:60S ribosomal protein L27a-3 [Populus alba x Populus x berolinensis]